MTSDRQRTYVRSSSNRHLNKQKREVGTNASGVASLARLSSKRNDRRTQMNGLERARRHRDELSCEGVEASTERAGLLSP